METLDLHPEELFDKVTKGLASDDERARAEAHLASCMTCRFERQVRMDFDAVGGSAADLDELVARALSGAKAVPEAPRRRRVGPLLIAASVALMAFGSFAAVAQYTGVLPRLFAVEPEVVVPPAPRQAPPPRQEVREVIPQEPPPPLVPAEEPVKAVKRAAPVREEPKAEVKPNIPPAPVEPDALAIFSRATQARVTGETAEAIRDFRAVVSRFPASPEAALSHAALGRLLLDRGDAASALESFDAYLSSNNQMLREDVQGSRAMALQALGRAEEERSAWEAVLHDYPSGVFAPRARTRLDSLTP
ncbi:MAG: hypothetical protein Q8K32_04810 [Archangium sp.]|nr:hypothetical protein [Archangium sp.]